MPDMTCKKLDKPVDIKNKELINRLCLGDEKALRILIKKFGNKIYTTAYAITGSYLDSDEVFQEVLISVYSKITDLKDYNAFENWIYRMTVNFSKAKLRNFKKERNLLERVRVGYIDMTIDNAAEIVDSPDIFLHNNDLKELLSEAVSDLPPKYKTVILLKDFNDFSIRKTSDILNISIPAVKSRLHRARKILKKKLYQHFQRTA